MANSAVVERDSEMVARARELKQELEKLVMEITEEGDVNLETVDKAQEKLSVLKNIELKKRSMSLELHQENNSIKVPDDFKCPLSKQLMRDPVIIASGQTYDRPFIQNWLKGGRRTCPLTQQVLSHTIVTPNFLVRDMISEWCKNHGLKVPDPNQFSSEYVLSEADRDEFLSLLTKISSTLSDRKDAAKKLRQLTKSIPSFRALFGEYVDAVPQMLSPFSGTETEIDPDLQEDIVTILLNTSIHENNKKLLAEMPMVIPFIIKALNSGKIETRSNAAATLFSLSAINSNKALIGESGALSPLISLLDEGDPLLMKDVASAIFNLCCLDENRRRAVQNGAISTILIKIMDRKCLDEMLATLALLSSNSNAIKEMGELGVFPCLLGILRESSCDRNKENCVVVLDKICTSDRSKLKEIREEEQLYGTISQLVRNGTARAKRKANHILEITDRVINKGIILTNTA